MAQSPLRRDHPRVCGKNAVYKGFEFLVVGSPPRVREKPCAATSLSWFFRITPACAGKTSWQMAQSPLRRDHPRVCGKNTSLLKCMAIVPGSPPRVREKLFNNLNWSMFPRITPACAGKTYVVKHSLFSWWDHPRVCGKNTFRPCGKNDLPGSPPRVREKH